MLYSQNLQIQTRNFFFQNEGGGGARYAGPGSPFGFYDIDGLYHKHKSNQLCFINITEW